MIKYVWVSECSVCMQIANPSSHSMLRTLALNSLHAYFILPILPLHISVAFNRAFSRSLLTPKSTFGWVILPTCIRHHNRSYKINSPFNDESRWFRCRFWITTRRLFIQIAFTAEICSPKMWKWCAVKWSVLVVCLYCVQFINLIFAFSFSIMLIYVDCLSRIAYADAVFPGIVLKYIIMACDI